MRKEDLELNRKAWNEKTPVHLASDFYAVDRFRAGESSLNPLEIDLVGDVEQKTLLHLQCHFGLDTISFARRGARACGLDFSDVAIAEATKLAAAEDNVACEFVCSDVHAAKSAVGNRTFDVVFTSYGAIGWLPDIEAWADAAVACVAPGGRLVVVEFHPFVWMWDDAFSKLVYPWDSGGVPIVETIEGTYADEGAPLTAKTVGWNHGLGSVVTALAKRGLIIERLEERTRSPYNVFASGVEDAPGEYYIERLGPDAPLVYGVAARRPDAD